MDFISTLAAITILFFAVFVIKQFFSKEISGKICALCISVSLTWISLLLMKYLGYFEDDLAIALFMGMTLLGIYYAVEKNVRKEITIFRLPFLLSLATLGYFILTLSNVLREVLYLSALWTFFITFYIYRNNPKVKKPVDKLVECCKKW